MFIVFFNAFAQEWGLQVVFNLIDFFTLNGRKYSFMFINTNDNSVKQQTSSVILNRLWILAWSKKIKKQYLTCTE